MSEVQSPEPNVSKSILERLHSLDDLPHFPEALIKLEQALSTNENIQIAEIAHLVAQDPRMVAGLIDVANSAKYYVESPASDLSEVIMRIGIQNVRVLAHAINFQTSFKRKPPFSDAHFLKHALLAAVVAQMLAARSGLNSGEAFLCGLMHDIGIYLLALEDRDGYIHVIREADYDVNKLIHAENQGFKTNHSVMSARLLQQWKFPQEVVMGVAYHHAPEKSPTVFLAYAFLTYLAEQGAFRLGFDNGVVDLSDEDRESPSATLLTALKGFNLELAEFDVLLEKAREEAEKSGMI